MKKLCVKRRRQQKERNRESVVFNIPSTYLTPPQLKPRNIIKDLAKEHDQGKKHVINNRLLALSARLNVLIHIIEL